MKKIILALIASTAALSGASHAQSVYVGASVAAIPYKFDVANSSSGDSSGTIAGGKAFIGYDFDKTWAIEGAYTKFGSKDYNYISNGQNGRITTDSYSTYVAAKVTMPINSQVSVFGKLGIADNHGTVEGTGAAAGIHGQNETQLYAGAGAQYAINEKFSLVAEVEHYGKTSDYGRRAVAVSFGGRYNF